MSSEIIRNLLVVVAVAFALWEALTMVQGMTKAVRLEALGKAAKWRRAPHTEVMRLALLAAASCVVPHVALAVPVVGTVAAVWVFLRIEKHVDSFKRSADILDYFVRPENRTLLYMLPFAFFKFTAAPIVVILLLAPS